MLTYQCEHGGYVTVICPTCEGPDDSDTTFLCEHGLTVDNCLDCNHEVD